MPRGRCGGCAMWEVCCVGGVESAAWEVWRCAMWEVCHVGGVEVCHVGGVESAV